jgi:hypothetical protein
MGTFVVDKSTLAMKLLNFIEQFPDKDNCKLKYKEVCDEIGVMIKNQSIYKTTCTSFDINITDSIWEINSLIGCL